ncbi:Uu.00g096250.m01.CDS01 [Anthostomella pinea]|uniref:aldehyde dehydrogenase (NAD(+)) n=1 Tax=Anthostomella pinea TaxID=933095 RepID=A0AAI8YEU3_9PEZI|nr:Uu.00g096250.m01.CDS01 [Anthostomella pinea]
MATNGSSSAVDKLDFTTFGNEGENPPAPVSTLEDVNRAVEPARNAAKSWAAVPMSKRQQVLKAFTDAFEAQEEGFVQMLVKEQGKSISEGHHEFRLSLQFLRGFCGLDLPEELLESSETRKVTVQYTPLGVVAGIVAWNYPIFIACGKIGQALATGNTLILKPSPFAPYCNLKLAELGTRFFPHGVFQALSGDDDLGPWLTEHPCIDVVSFTGSVALGKQIGETCGKSLKRCILELGGNDPAIVCADVDIAAIAPVIAYLTFANSGQICIIPKRVYVHDSIYDKFLSILAAYATNLSLKQEEQGAIGPVSNQPQYERVKHMLEDIERNHLTIAAGSTKPLTDRRGFFLSPTLVDNSPDSSRIVTEEPLGPVVPVMRWTDESDVINRANNTDFGLSASVWSRDAAQAECMARQLQAGNIWINTHAATDPKFSSGSFKNSANGANFGVMGLKAYCNLQTIHARLG